MDLQDLLEAAQLKPIVEPRNIWLLKSLIILIMEFQLIFGL